MPNWCANAVVITATEHESAQMIRRLDTHLKEGGGLMSFFIPIPPELNDPRTGSFGGAGTAQFAFDTTATTATTGDTIASKPAGNTSTATMVFLGNIAFTTEAGIYQTTLTYVATGQY